MAERQFPSQNPEKITLNNNQQVTVTTKGAITVITTFNGIISVHVTASYKQALTGSVKAGVARIYSNPK